MNSDKDKHANRDPISGSSKADSVGAEVGNAARELVGGSPTINAADEETYWRGRHSGQPYAQNRPFDEYQGAYRTGWEGWAKNCDSGRTFAGCEGDLRNEYERNRGKSNLNWDEARGAAEAAWRRVSGNHERLAGYEVQDMESGKIGTVNNVWIDHTRQPAFLGVKTGWLGMGKNHVVPVHTAQVNDRQRVIRLPVSEEKIKNAPSFDADADLSSTDEEQIYAYYGVQQSQPTGGQQQQRGRQFQAGDGKDAETVELSEEQLKVGKREVSAGGVRLRKVIRTETVQQPIELKREEIVIERVPGSGEKPAGTCFEEQDVFIALRREEPVVEKEARVREQVRVSKKTKTDRQEISESLRKEDVEIEKQDKPRFGTEPGARRKTERYEHKERGKQR